MPPQPINQLRFPMLVSQHSDKHSSKPHPWPFSSSMVGCRVHVWAYGSQRKSQGIFYLHFDPPYFLRQNLLGNLELTNCLDWQAGNLSRFSCLFSPALKLKVQATSPSFSRRCWGIGSGPHAYVASTQTTEPFHGPQIPIF